MSVRLFLGLDLVIRSRIMIIRGKSVYRRVRSECRVSCCGLCGLCKGSIFDFGRFMDMIFS